MKVQYFGDVNDYRKFALLRLLARDAELKIGVCWMMTEPDERSDGNLRGYLRQPERWRQLDPDVFDALSKVSSPPSVADLSRVENEGIISSAIFFSDSAPDELAKRTEFHNRCMLSLSETELVFFDPDNGLEVPSFKKGSKQSNKYAFYDEIVDHFERGKSILVYQHFPRKPRTTFIREVCSKASSIVANSRLWSLETPYAAFLIIAHKDHSDRIAKAVEFIEQNWVPEFFKGVKAFAPGG